MAGDGPSVLLTTEHVIPILIKHKILPSTLRAYDSISRSSGMGAPSAWQTKFTLISPVKRVGCLLGRKLARKTSGIQFRCHVFSLREGSACIWESVGGVGKWRSKMVSSRSVGQAMKYWALCRLRVCSLRVKAMSPSKYWWKGQKRMRWTVNTRCRGTDGAWALISNFESTVYELWSRVRGSRVKGGMMSTVRGAPCKSLAAGFGFEPDLWNCRWRI